MTIVLPDGSILKSAKDEENERKVKLRACPPDKFIVSLAADVILSPDEWLEVADYDVVVNEDQNAGSVYLLRKVEL